MTPATDDYKGLFRAFPNRPLISQKGWLLMEESHLFACTHALKTSLQQNSQLTAGSRGQKPTEGWTSDSWAAASATVTGQTLSVSVRGVLVLKARVWEDFRGSRFCSQLLNRLPPLPYAWNPSSLSCNFPSLKKGILFQSLNLVGRVWRLNHVCEVC